MVAAFDDAEFARHPLLVRGYIGPEALGAESATGVRYLTDPRVVDRHRVGDRGERSGDAT